LNTQIIINTWDKAKLNMEIYILTIIFSLSIITIQIIKQSNEFKELHRLANKKKWIRYLLKCGPFFAERTKWSLKKAWPYFIKKYNPNPEKLNEIIQTIATVKGFNLISPNRCDRIDIRKMELLNKLSGEWVCELKHPGLTSENGIICKAVVVGATPDYLSLLITSAEELTEKYKKYDDEFSNNSYSLKLKPAVTLRLTEIVNDQKMNSWLIKLVDAAPGQELTLIAPEPGNPFNNNKMITIKDIISPIDAVVEKCLRCGLEHIKNNNNETLLNAIVVAKDTEITF